MATIVFINKSHYTNLKTHTLDVDVCGINVRSAVVRVERTAPVMPSNRNLSNFSTSSASIADQRRLWAILEAQSTRPLANGKLKIHVVKE